MPTAKVTYFMEDPEGYGSSESFYQNFGGDLTTILESAQTLFKARMGLCGKGMTGTYLRLSNDAIFNDSLVDTTTYIVELTQNENPSVGGNQANPVFIKGGSATAPPCLPNLVLSARFTLQGAGRAIKYLHGLPTDVITTPPGPNFTPEFNGQWNAWKALFPKAGGIWQIKVRDTSPPNAKTNVQSIASPALGQYVITAPGHTIPAMGVFRLGGFKNYQGIRGTYTATAVTANTITVEPGPIAQITLPNKGYVQGIGYSYANIQGIQPDEECFRKAGRPFGLRPGRRPVSSGA